MGAIKEERLLQPGKPLHWHGDQPGWKGSLVASEESAAGCSWQPEQRKKNGTDSQYHQALLSPTCKSTGAGRGGVLELRLQVSEAGRGLGLESSVTTPGGV